MSNMEKHWNQIYSEKDYTEVTWFQSYPSVSLKLINSLNLSKDSSILDVGCGATMLLDVLIAEGFQNITAIDLSHSALEQLRQRLSSNQQLINWIEGDITIYHFDNTFDLWHDRAVFHFLTTEQEQQLYINQLNKYLKANGNLIISTFAEDGPLKCSGLEIKRYAKDELIDKFSEFFEFLHFEKETHVSPKGMEQKFNYWVFRKK